MSPSETMKARAGFVVVFGLGSGLFLLHVVHAVGEGESLETFFYGILLPMLFTVGLLAGGVWLWRSEFDGEFVLRVGAWCVIGALVLSIGSILIIQYEQAEGVIMSHRLFVVANAVSVGSVVGFVVGVYDARQQVAQDRLAVARDRSERLSRQLTVLNRVVRHDIRNSANVIQGHSELLVERSEWEEKRAETIRQRAAKLVELGEHARSIERMLHEDESTREVIDVSALVRTHLEPVRHDHPPVDVRVSLPDACPIYVHPLIDSAIVNVIDNAIEHNDKPTPRIDVEYSYLRSNGTEYVEIWIADNGPSIPDNEIDVLERGYETPLEHTNGLGLWLVNWIVTESGGDVRFEENQPEGNVVCLRFERSNTELPAEIVSKRN